MCKLGTHSPQCMGNEMEIDSGKNVSSVFVLIDCPQSMKIDSSSASMLGSISDYFLSLSNGWDLESYLKSLSKVLRNLKLGSCMTMNPEEGSTGPCTVIYVVCPFAEPLAVLQTVIESSIAAGSVILSSDKERRSTLQNQVGKALSYSAAVDESLPNVLTLSGFCIPKLVLQIVTVDAIFRITNPAVSGLVILKEIAFTVYYKARRISRGSSRDMVQSSSMSGRSHPVLMQMTSPVPGMWKDCVGPRSIGTSLQREAELDASLRSGSWDNWQTSRGGGLGCDPNRMEDFSFQDEVRYLFEPLYILAEPGSLDRGLSFPMSCNPMAESSKLLLDDCTGENFMQSSASSGGGDTGTNNQSETSEPDGFGSAHQKSLPSLHCCYGWTDDWRWLVCIWTDSRGELLDNYIYPFGGISSRQDTKGLQSLFVQIL
nr:PREDICTED: mediator of RNA polymerase II transcription subunit 13-like isoform X4 [Nicotiana tabacum]